MNLSRIQKRQRHQRRQSQKNQEKRGSENCRAYRNQKEIIIYGEA